MILEICGEGERNIKSSPSQLGEKVGLLGVNSYKQKLFKEDLFMSLKNDINKVLIKGGNKWG